VIIICDTSGLSALLRIDQLQILADLYGKVLIPPKVYEELLSLSELGVDVKKLDSLPWLSIHPISNFDLFNQLLLELDEGESQAICLALELNTDWLIIDELDGREKARQLEIPIIGIGGVLVMAKKKGIIPSVKGILDRLRVEANFRLSEKIYQHLLRAAGE